MPPKDFKNAMNKLTSREVVLRGDKGAERPFGEGLREELERVAQNTPVGEIPLERLSDNPFQHLARPSLDEEALEELADSIRQNGFYGALLARRKRGLLEEYELAYGHRRKEAARRAGLATLPVKVLDLSDSQMARIMASENFSREDLTPIGEANIIGHLYNRQNLPVTDISRTVGKGAGWVNLRLGLYTAPEEIKRMVEQKPETLGHIRLLLQVKDPEERKGYIAEILAGRLTRDKLDKQLKAGEKSGKPGRARSGKAQKIVKEDTIFIPYKNSEKSNNLSTEPGDITTGAVGDAYYRVSTSLDIPALLQQLSALTGGLEKAVSLDFMEMTEADQFFLDEIIARLTALKNR
jgi:ParB family chromosome partitioning protein